MQNGNWAHEVVDDYIEGTTLKQAFSVMKNNGARSGILDGLLIDTGLEQAWTTDPMKLHQRMLTMVSDWSTDRTGGPGAFPFTKAVAEAVLESETVTGWAQRTTARKTQEQVDNLSDASIAKWAHMDSSSSRGSG